MFPSDASAGVGATSLLDPVPPELAALLGEPDSSPPEEGSEDTEAADDGYSTTVDEEDFHASTQPLQWNDLFDFKCDAPTVPGILVDNLVPATLAQPEQVTLPSGLPMELVFSPQNTTAFAAPPLVNNVPHHEDPATVALLQILTQAALQQSPLLMSQHVDHLTHHAADLHHPAAAESVSPRDVSPSRTPSVVTSSAVTGSELAASAASAAPAAPAEPVAWSPLAVAAADVSIPSECRNSRSHSVVSSSIESQSIKKRKRRTRTPLDLLPLDAPVQARTYTAPSATSRRELEDDAEQEDDEVKALLAKRRKNTLAARQSRHRKAEELQDLKDRNQVLADRNAELQCRLQDAEMELASFRLRMQVDDEL